MERVRERRTMTCPECRVMQADPVQGLGWWPPGQTVSAVNARWSEGQPSGPTCPPDDLLRPVVLGVVRGSAVASARPVCIWVTVTSPQACRSDRQRETTDFIKPRGPPKKTRHTDCAGSHVDAHRDLVSRSPWGTILSLRPENCQSF